MSLLESLKNALPDLRYDSEFWRRFMRAGVVHGPETFIRLSPPLFGWGFALAMPKVRARVAENLRAAGKRGTALEVMQVFSTYALSLTEAFAVGSGRNERISARIVGDANFQAARAMGRGVIVATAHTSGWYAAGPILGSVYDDEVLLVMQDERDPNAQRVQQQARDAMGLRVVTVGSDPLAAMPLLAHLKKGGIVALQADRAPKGVRSVEVTLGGRPFFVPEGPLTLAALSGAPIVVVLGRRCSFLQYEVEVGPAITLPRRPTRDELVAAAQALSARIEAFVRRHPTDWFHFEG
jgi:phosphatidylinositol dimannoside acyltransferase